MGQYPLQARFGGDAAAAYIEADADERVACPSLEMAQLASAIPGRTARHYSFAHLMLACDAGSRRGRRCRGRRRCASRTRGGCRTARRQVHLRHDARPRLAHLLWQHDAPQARGVPVRRQRRRGGAQRGDGPLLGDVCRHGRARGRDGVAGLPVDAEAAGGPAEGGPEVVRRSRPTIAPSGRSSTLSTCLPAARSRRPASCAAALWTRRARGRRAARQSTCDSLEVTTKCTPRHAAVALLRPQIARVTSGSISARRTGRSSLWWRLPRSRSQPGAGSRDA